MTTAKQTAANRQNAQASTGPTSAEGKAAVARNATKVGVFSRSPVVAGLEDAAEWEAFRDDVVEDLQAVGTLEVTLARRVADALWRLQRVSKFEAATVERNHFHWTDRVTLEDGLLISRLTDDGKAAKKAGRRIESARERLDDWHKGLAIFMGLRDTDESQEIDGMAFVTWLQEIAMQVMPGITDVDHTGFLWEDDFLAPLAPPPCPVDDPRGNFARDAWRRPGWTAGQGIQAVAMVMDKAGVELKEAIPAREAFLRRAVKDAEANRDAALENSVGHMQRVTDSFTAPTDAEVAKLVRWEAHLARQQSLALQELQRVQARRGVGVGHQQVNGSVLPSASGRRSQEVVVRVLIEQAPPAWHQGELFASAGGDGAAEATNGHNGHGGAVPDVLARRGAVLQNKPIPTNGSHP